MIVKVYSYDFNSEHEYFSSVKRSWKSLKNETVQYRKRNEYNEKFVLLKKKNHLYSLNRLEVLWTWHDYNMHIFIECHAE